MEELLKPIQKDIGLKKWWPGVKQVFAKLLDTFDGNPDKDWWARIIDIQHPHGSGDVTKYDGWFVADMLGIQKKRVKLEDFPRGFTTVPITITDLTNKDEGAFIGGIAGFKTNLKPDNGSAPYVEPVHGWTLLLDRNSVFRKQP